MNNGYENNENVTTWIFSQFKRTVQFLSYTQLSFRVIFLLNSTVCQPTFHTQRGFNFMPPAANHIPKVGFLGAAKRYQKPDIRMLIAQGLHVYGYKKDTRSRLIWLFLQPLAQIKWLKISALYQLSDVTGRVLCFRPAKSRLQPGLSQTGLNSGTAARQRQLGYLDRIDKWMPPRRLRCNSRLAYAPIGLHWILKKNVCKFGRRGYNQAKSAKACTSWA